MKSNWILLGLLYFITCACQKKEADLLSPVKQTGDLEITVLYQQQPVENTEVTLFYTQTDLQRNQNPYRLPQLTDINGKLLWNELEAGRTYFFYAKKDTVMASGSVLNGNAVQPNIVNRFTAVLGPRPACELNNWGAIYVVNSSNRKFRIWMDGNFLREINPNSAITLAEIPIGLRTFKAVMENDTFPNYRNFIVVRCGLDTWNLP